MKEKEFSCKELRCSPSPTSPISLDGSNPIFEDVLLSGEDVHTYSYEMEDGEVDRIFCLDSGIQQYNPDVRVRYHGEFDGRDALQMGDAEKSLSPLLWTEDYHAASGELLHRHVVIRPELDSEVLARYSQEWGVFDEDTRRLLSKTTLFVCDEKLIVQYGYTPLFEIRDNDVPLSLNIRLFFEGESLYEGSDEKSCFVTSFPLTLTTEYQGRNYGERVHPVHVMLEGDTLSPSEILSSVNRLLSVEGASRRRLREVVNVRILNDVSGEGVSDDIDFSH